MTEETGKQTRLSPIKHQVILLENISSNDAPSENISQHSFSLSFFYLLDQICLTP